MKAILVFITVVICINFYGQIKLMPYGIGITVKNADSASMWYQRNLDFKVYKKMELPEYDSLKIYFLRQGDFNLELVEKKTSFSISNLKPDYNEDKAPLRGFAKIVFYTDHIQQTFEKLKRNGAKEVMGIAHDKEFDIDFFIVADFDGNAVQFIERKTK